MRLPPTLLTAIEQETSLFERRQLARATAELTERYQSGSCSSLIVHSEVHRAAYLAVRLPATFAAVWQALSQVRALAQQLEIRSMLDLGAGPGTALFAAAEVFPDLREATLVETDAAWFKAGKRMAAITGVKTQWLQHDLRTNLDCTPHDLVVISYALGELPGPALESVLRSAWHAARNLLVIVEPGTVRGFSKVHAARSWMLANGAKLVAPCPHHNACPMAAAGEVPGARDFRALGRGDWCHFAQRVERTSLHRSLKGGDLGHEDEKFSYVAAAREAVGLPGARIVRHPQKHTGHVQLSLCTPEGLASSTVTKSQKLAYKEARKADWGDVWNG